MFDTACWNKPDWRVCVDKHWPEERMLARPARRNQDMRGGSELEPQFAQVLLSMTRGHSSRTITRAGRGDTVVNVMRLACLRRILFTTLHIGVRCRRRSRSSQSGILWVGLSRRASRAPAAA